MTPGEASLPRGKGKRKKSPRGPSRILEQLLEERNERLSQLTALVSIARSITSSLHLEHVLGEILSQLKALRGSAGAGSVMLAERGQLRLRSAFGAPPVESLDLGEGLAGLAAAQGRIMLWDRANCPDNLVPETSGMDNLLVVPMRVRDVTIGCLCLFGQGQGSYSSRDINLLSALASQAAIAVENAKLYEERDRVTELLQTTLIPDRLSFPGVRVAHRHHPSKTLSGDYYDLFPLTPRRLAIVIADVAGKGPEAGIHTVGVKYIVRGLATMGAGPRQILTQLNRQILEQKPGGRHVTLFIADLELESGRLRYARAGHDPALLWTGREVLSLEAEGLMLGATPDPEFEEREILLPRGAVCLLYTDGLTEARSPEGDFFGLDRVRDILSRAGPDGPTGVVHELAEAVACFTRDSYRDDMSMLALALGGPPRRLSGAEGPLWLDRSI